MTDQDSPRHATDTPNRWITSPAARRWLYGVGAAVLAVAGVYGLLSPEQLGAWRDVLDAALIAGAGGLTLATANTPR